MLAVLVLLLFTLTQGCLKMKELRISDINGHALLVLRVDVKGEDYIHTPRFGGIEMKIGQVTLKDIKEERKNTGVLGRLQQYCRQQYR